MIIFCNPLDNDKIDMIERQLSIPYQVIPMFKTVIHSDDSWIDKANEHNGDWVVTSKNAADAILAKLSELNFPQHIYCVGPSTARMFEDLTINISYPDTYNSDSLAELIIQDKAQNILHLKGNLAGEGLIEKLKENKIKAEGVEVYETIKTPIPLDLKKCFCTRIYESFGNTII